MMLTAIAAKLGAKASKAPQEATTLPAPEAPPVQQKQHPNEAIFNTQFTTAGKRFLTKIKKNRAMQVDRRTRGFQLGLEQRTVVTDPLTGGHYRIMLVDPDMLRRENLADELEQRFEIFVAPSNERAFALLGLFQVNFILLRLDIGNDQTAATSPALAFLREMKRSCFRTPVAALVDPSFSTDHEAQKLLARALQQGGVCGFFEEGLSPDIMTQRIAKLLRLLSVAQNELARCRGTATPDARANKAPNRAQPQAKQPQHSDNQLAGKARATPPSSASGPKRLPAAEVPNTRPSSVNFDRPGMLLELSLNQRKQCLRQREALQATLASAPHSVLGVDIDASPVSPASRPATPLTTCISPVPPSFGSTGRQTKVKKNIPPLPSPKQVSQLIYTRPQDLQTRIGRHLYERLHIAGPPGPVPQDPLLNHCLVIDPRAQGRDLVVGKAYMLYCEQRLDEALLHCDRALRTPNSTLEKLARLLRGALYDARGEHGRAEAEFLACLQLDPAMHEAHFNLSVARLKLGKDALALEALTRALTLDPQNDKYLQNRGLMYRRMGFFVQAQSEYCKREMASGAASAPLAVQSTHAAGSRRTISNRGANAVGTASASSVPRNTQLTTRGTLSKCELEDGLFAHLFGKPTPDKLALACPSAERSAEKLRAIVARLQTLLFFQDFSREMLTQVAQALDYDVVACGKSFVLGETHSHNFYVLLGGRLSIRRRVGTTDFGSTVTTHHLGAGSVFGCAGFTISAQASLIADECAEIGILWPDDYAATIRAVTSQTNQDVFAFLQQLRGFRLLTTSELGHIVGISERKRFRQGDVLLEQNEQPRHLIVLWKGSCSVYQDFDSAPLSRRKLRRSADFDGWNEDDEEDDSASDESDGQRGDEGEDKGSPPFHHLIAKPDWPLGFQARTRARKYRRGRRDGLVLSQTPPLVVGSLGGTAPPRTLTLSLPMRRLKDKLSSNDKKALVHKCVAPAVFGESRFLDPTHAPAKCCVVAESLVEVLLFDHMRLQEMDLQPDVVSELFDAAPKYLSEKEVAQKQADVATWDEYRNLRVLELAKNRWPEAKASRANGLANVVSFVTNVAFAVAARHRDTCERCPMAAASCWPTTAAAAAQRWASRGMTRLPPCFLRLLHFLVYIHERSRLGPDYGRTHSLAAQQQMDEEPPASSRGRWLARRRASRLDSGGSRGESSPSMTALAALLLSSHPRASMTGAAVSRGTSVGDDDDEREEPADASPNVYKFDVAQYKDGSFRFVPACARDLIKYTGRLLHHGAQAARKTKINTVQFDWPAVAFQISVRGTASVAIRLKGDGNYFNVFVDDELRCILRASLSATCCDVATDLDTEQEYTIRICKRTEPQMRGAMSTFKVCTFYGFIVDDKAEVLPVDQPEPQPVRKMEFIGDSDTCGFGNEGKASSAKNLFGMKGRMENVYNGYACITARMFDAEEHALAWSGKGVHSNSADWGPNMPALWKNTLASRPGDWDMSSWIPDVVVINLGINDLSPPASAETDIVTGYATFLLEVRSYRPDAHIFCVVYDDGCISSEDSETNRKFVSLQLQEIVKVAISKVSKHDDKMHYTFIKVEEGLEKEDYASMMHYAVSGHVKIAKVLVEEIALRTGWSVEREPETMPYPQAKDQILTPRDHSKTSCAVS
ncbi:hypothetical protein PHYPSEUDO_005471 [Phytophthora pseudosyringae]|uniref:Cyclic nucleotide-binding domain-containing protein n=1 Tax=Phytophthora pseudosyringae TaxID=221518 RepID=A0A8T1VRA0_9STRA|nr:hypothetical protein PHYPSEUDO_005471 [Phytophthora pseudosyringae]